MGLILELIVTIILGGIVGWLASKVMHTDEEQGAVANVIVGVVGAFLANLVVRPFLGASADVSHFNVVGLVVAFIGACLLLALVNLFRGRSVRP